MAQSKEATKKFIQEQVSASDMSGESVRWFEMSFTGDTMIYRVGSYSRKRGETKEGSRRKAQVVTGALKDLNPDRVEVDKSRPNASPFFSGIELFTTEGRRTIKVITESEKKTGLWICTKDNRTAERVGRALIHLIKLCGGKGDLFGK